MKNILVLHNDIIIRYLDGSASSEEKILLLDWLKENDQNRKMFADIKNIWVSTMVIYSDDLETEVALDKFRERIREYQSKADRKKKILYYSWRVAAFVAIVLGFSYFLSQYTGIFTHKDRLAVVNQVIMPAGSKGSISLPDGSLVWLNSSSKIIFPEVFDGENRSVRLEGEAYFDVVRNEKQPFIVQLGEMEVTVLGTQFNISGYDSRDEIETTLLSGSVRVRMEDSKEEFILKPDEKFSYSKSEKRSSVEPVRAGIYTSWATDRLVFDNEKLGDVLLKLERWYNIRIVCPKSLSEKVRISFTLRLETKEQTFKAMSEVAPIKYRINEDEVFIYEK